MAKILIVGDLHLSSSNRGRHHNYPEYTLGFLRDITKLCKEHQITHLIDLGDLSYGNFRLAYRHRVEQILEEQFNLVNGERYTVHGNHDVDASGISEHDYYSMHRGLLKITDQLDPAPNLRFHFIPEGQAQKRQLEILDGAINIVLGHDYFIFNNSQMPNYGDVNLIEQMPQWYNTDMAILGHIHEFHELEGEIVNEIGDRKPYKVLYPGSPGITTFKKNMVDDKSRYILIDTGNGSDSGEVTITILEVARAPHEEVFKEAQVKLESNERVEYDIRDILQDIDSKEVVGTDIRNLVLAANADDQVKNRAVEILDLARSAMI